VLLDVLAERERNTEKTDTSMCSLFPQGEGLVHVDDLSFDPVHCRRATLGPIISFASSARVVSIMSAHLSLPFDRWPGGFAADGRTNPVDAFDFFNGIRVTDGGEQSRKAGDYQRRS